jgi:hypothetical protein
MRYSILIIVGLLGIFSCQKEVISNDPPYIEQWWDKFYGTYVVFDTLNDVTYQMEINQIERYFDGKSFSDSIYVSNFVNRFNIKILQTAVNASNLHIGVHFGIADSFGHNWALSGTHYWNDSKDTLKLYYTLSNIAFYAEEGVPYYSVESTDLAVKIE